jgi:hypothetical protein
LKIGRSHRVPTYWSTLGGGWLPLCISPETAGWGRKCERGRCHGEAARSVLAKVRGHVFARYRQSPQNVAVEPGIHSLAWWNCCFALPQLLYRWRHQSGIFWIPPRTVTSKIYLFLQVACSIRLFIFKLLYSFNFNNSC